MKILHILSSDDIYGSALSFLELLTQELRTPGIEPYVILPCKNRIADYCYQQGVKYRVLAYQQVKIPKHNNVFLFALKYVYRFLRYHYENPRALKALGKIVKEEKPDLIHTNSSVIDLGAELNRLYGVPHVWHLREFGKEDFNFYPFRRNLSAYMNKYTTRFIAISKAVQKTWIRKGLSPSKIEVVLHGVNGLKFDSLPSRIAPSDKIRLVMCGSFTQAKGQIYVLNALAALPSSYREKFSIAFYGKPVGEYYKKFVKAIRRLKLEKQVAIKGYSTDLEKELVLYDVAIMCSRAEAMGRVTIEYMFAGLCPIASRRGANIELIEENNCGLLFDYEDPSSLTHVLQQVIDNPASLRAYAERSYRISREKFDSRQNIAHILDLFNRQIK